MLLHKPKTLVIDPLGPSVIQALECYLDVSYKINTSFEELNEYLLGTDVLIVRSGHIITDLWLDKMPNLKAVIRAGSGVDNIPFESLKNRKIHFSNIPNANVNAVAEFGLGAILMMLRNMYPALSSMKQGRWEKSKFTGSELLNQTIGLIGYGRIGKLLADKLALLGSNVLYFQRTEADISCLPNIKRASLKELCSRSSIISIQVPLTEQTYKFINDDFFDLIENPCHIINLSRYNILDMNSIIKAIENKKVKSVFVDPVEKDTDLTIFEGLPIYFTPHIAGSTNEAQDKIGTEIIKLLTGWQLIN